MLHILLDSYPLGILSHPKPDPDILKWAAACQAAGHKIYIPEVIDYEVRRELVRAQKTAGVGNLNALKTVFRFLPLTTPAMLLAADLWARARSGGYTTGDPKKLVLVGLNLQRALFSVALLS